MVYGRPGVYVSESLLPAAIPASASVNAAGAAIGIFSQGPTTPTLVSSWYQFVQLFGSYDANYPATFGVAQYFVNGGSDLYVCRVLHSDAAAATVTLPGASSGSVATITALNKGASGNNLLIQATPVAGTTTFFDLAVYQESEPGDLLLETFRSVTFLSANSASPDYAQTVINQQSQYISLTITSSNTLEPATTLLALTGGSNGTAPVAADFATAAATLNIIDRPLVVFLPEVTNDTVLGAQNGPLAQDAVVAVVAPFGWFTVIDTPGATGSYFTDTAAGALVYSAARAAANTGYANQIAVYYPQIYVPDPLARRSGSLRKIGSAGAVAGLYLKTDAVTGPFKSPAGLSASLPGAVATGVQLSSSDLDSLNSNVYPVNAIRNIPGANVVVFGGRTLQQDGTANKYVNTRRSLTYIEFQLKSITRFAIFENNDARLWAKLRTAVTVFLNAYQNQGGLSGNTPAQGFFVKCDGENNPASTIANGQVNIAIGVALEYPAEFVVINLSQQTSV